MCLPLDSFDSAAVMTPWSSTGNLQLTAMSTAESHTCGLSTLGTMYCAGMNTYGQLLNGRTSAQRVTTPIETNGVVRYRSVTAGGFLDGGYTCAIRSADSVVMCAGRNYAYQTGHTPMVDADSLLAPVTGNLKALSVSAGRSHTCAVALDRSLYCWERNDRGLFGVSETTLYLTPIPQRIPGNIAFASVSSGSHTCALSTAQELYCWGSNASGQLGIAVVDTLQHLVPQKIVLATTVKAVTAGNGYTCALTTAGALYCWGLVPGSTEFRSLLGNARYSPVRMARGITFKSMSANSRQICGVTTDGRGVCL